MFCCPTRAWQIFLPTFTFSCTNNNQIALQNIENPVAVAQTQEQNIEQVFLERKKLNKYLDQSLCPLRIEREENKLLPFPSGWPRGSFGKCFFSPVCSGIPLVYIFSPDHALPIKLKRREMFTLLQALQSCLDLLQCHCK